MLPWRTDDDLHGVVGTQSGLHGQLSLIQPELVGDRLVERNFTVVLGQHDQSAVIGPGILPGHPDDGEVPAQDCGRVDRNRAKVDESTNLDQRSPVAQEIKRWTKAGRMTGGVDHYVRSPTLGQVPNLFEQRRIAGCGRDHVGGTEFHRQLGSSTIRIDGDDPSGIHDCRLGSVDQSHRSSAHDHHRVAGSEATRARRLTNQIETVSDGEQLGQDGNGCRQTIRHLEDGGAGTEVEILGPAPEQMGRFGRGQGVAIVLEIPAEVVGKVVTAVVTLAASPVRGRDHPITDLKAGSVEGLAPPSPTATTRPTFS